MESLTKINLQCQNSIWETISLLQRKQRNPFIVIKNILQETFSVSPTGNEWEIIQVEENR